MGVPTILAGPSSLVQSAELPCEIGLESEESTRGSNIRTQTDRTTYAFSGDPFRGRRGLARELRRCNIIGIDSVVVGSSLQRVREESAVENWNATLGEKGVGGRSRYNSMRADSAHTAACFT